MALAYADLFEDETKPKKVFSYEDLFEPKKPRKVFSVEELFETQTELLAKAQKVVKWREELDTPSKWTSEFWSSLGESIKEQAERHPITPEAWKKADQIFTKEFYTESGKKLVKDAVEMAVEEVKGRPRRWGMRYFRALAPQITPYAGLVPPTEERPVVEAGKEVAKSAVDYVTFLPKTAFNLAKDPIGTMRGQPLDVLTLVGAVAGVKIAKGIKAKATAKKWVTTGDFIDPIVESKMVSKQLKTRLLEVPSDIEFEIGIKKTALTSEQFYKIYERDYKSVAIKDLSGKIWKATKKHESHNALMLKILKHPEGRALMKMESRARYAEHWGFVTDDVFYSMGDIAKAKNSYYKAYLKRAPSIEPLEIIKTKKGGGQPFFKHWFEGIKKDIKNAGDIPDRPLKYHKLYGMRVPIRTFEMYPWMKRILYDEARIGKFNAVMEEKAFRAELKTWKKKLPGKSQERVGIYADYMQEGGAEIMKAMGKKKPELTAPEMQYYHWGQKAFRDFLPRLNQARGMAGEKPIGKVVNYSTWIRNLNELSDLGIDFTKAPVEMIDFHLNSIPLSMAKHRAPGILKAGVELNYGLLLDNYARQSLNHIHMTPVIAKARTLLEPFKAQKWDMFKETPRLATWLQEWTDTIAGQKRMLPPGRAKMFTKVANTLNKNIAMAILSYNVRSALIQPTAIKLAYTLLGEKYTVHGLLKNLSPTARKFAVKNSKHLATRIFDIHAAEIMQSQLGKKFLRTKQAVAQWGMKPLQYLDFETARATWLGAYEMATKKYGYKLKRATTYADDIVTRTQASAQLFDIAPIQRTAGGRLLTLFQTFVINEYDMLTHDIFGYKNPYMNMATRSKNIARFVVASATVNAIYEGVFKLRSPYPAPEWELMRGIQEGDEPIKIAGGMVRELMEQLPIVGGTIRWSTPYRVAFPAFVQTGVVDPLTMLNRLLEKPSLTNDQLEWVGKIMGIPGTSQVSKYVRRRKKGMSHVEAIVGIRTTLGARGQPSW